MKISNIFNTSNFYKSNVKKLDNTKNIKTKNDNLDISSKAMDFKLTLSAVKTAPDVREDKILSIMEKMENKTYSISSEELASKLLSEF